MFRLDHVSKRFVGPSGMVDALKGVSFHVEKHELDEFLQVFGQCYKDLVP